MAGIDIQHTHSLPIDKARQAVDEVAATLADRFGVQSHWVGDTLAFTRSGIDGAIALAPEEVHVTAKLGFMLSAMKSPIESEINRLLAERFA